VCISSLALRLGVCRCCFVVSSLLVGLACFFPLLPAARPSPRYANLQTLSLAYHHAPLLYLPREYIARIPDGILVLPESSILFPPNSSAFIPTVHKLHVPPSPSTIRQSCRLQLEQYRRKRVRGAMEMAAARLVVRCYSSLRWDLVSFSQICGM
jgi:hypothetical protein